MINNVTITASNAYGQQGAYVARIVGIDRKFGFEREFLGSTSPVIFEPGIYEICSINRHGCKEIGYYFVFAHPTKTGEIRKTRVDKSDVATLVGAHRTVSDVRFEWVPDAEDAAKGKWMFDLSARPNRAALQSERETLITRLAEIEAALQAHRSNHT